MYLKSHRDLDVYKMAFNAAMRIFHLTKEFPKEEKYELVSQIRSASRSVCSCVAEGWRKRRYKKMFVNKMTDAQQEAGETQTWLEFSLACEYLDEETYKELDEVYEHIIGKLNAMEIKADSFCFKPE